MSILITIERAWSPHSAFHRPPPRSSCQLCILPFFSILRSDPIPSARNSVFMATRGPACPAYRPRTPSSARHAGLCRPDGRMTRIRLHPRPISHGPLCSTIPAARLSRPQPAHDLAKRCADAKATLRFCPFLASYEAPRCFHLLPVFLTVNRRVRSFLFIALNEPRFSIPRSTGSTTRAP